MRTVRLLLEKDDVGDIIECPDGIDVLEKAVDVKPDLILMDIMMPKVGGLEAFRCLKASPITAEIPVIMRTAKGDQGLLQQAKEA